MTDDGAPGNAYLGLNSELEMQALLRISVSIGRSLDLQTMIVRSLKCLVQVTDSLGAIVLKRAGDGQGSWEFSGELPEHMVRHPLFQRLTQEYPLEMLWKRLNDHEAGGYLMVEVDSCRYYVFLLPSFGLLFILKPALCLSMAFCAAFTALADKLAQCCLACEQNEELEKWREFERLLTRFSLRFITAREPDLDPLMEEALEKFGQLVKADRAFIFSYDFEAYTASNTHEWCAPGISSEKANLQSYPLDGLEVWVRAHQAGEIYRVADVTALPPGDPVRQALAPQGIRSVVSIPIMGSDGCRGLVGFDSVRHLRHWGRIDVTMLRSLADMMANAEIRRQRQREMAKIQRELVESRDRSNRLALQAQAANEAKSRFLATVSHELRTPITAMLGVAELLMGSNLDERQSRHVKSLVKSGESLRGIVNEVLDYSEIEAGRLKIHLDVVELPKMLKETIHLLEHSARSRGNELRLDLAPDLPTAVLLDPVRMHQIIWNLVGNAIKFTTNGLIVCSVRMESVGRSMVGCHRLRFSVSDTGIGISRQLQGKVFEPFFQVPGVSEKGRTGTGLGLSIVQHLVQAMGGRLHLESKAGLGTRVWFVLDVQEGALEDREPSGMFEMLAPLAHPPGASCRQPDVPRRPRILLAEDNDDVRDLVAETLQSLGCSVLCAAHGKEAVDYHAKSRFDLVLMDCQMPVMNGLLATRLIRKQGEHGRRVPIIALTAALSRDQWEAYLEAGMDDWLPKPYTRKELAKKLEKWFEVDR